MSNALLFYPIHLILILLMYFTAKRKIVIIKFKLRSKRRSIT